MYTQLRFTRTAALLVAISLPVFGQLGKILNKKNPEADAAKNQLRYEALKQYSNDKYQKDLNFRDEVDAA